MMELGQELVGSNTGLNSGVPSESRVSAGSPMAEAVTQWAVHDGETYRVGYDPINDLVIVDGKYRKVTNMQRAVLSALISAPDVLRTDDDLCQAVWGCSSDLTTSLPATLNGLRDSLGGNLADRKQGAIITRSALGKRIVKSLIEPYQDARKEPQNVAIEGVLSTVPSMKIALINNSVPVELKYQQFSALDLLTRMRGVTVSMNGLASELAVNDRIDTASGNVRVSIKELRMVLSEAGFPAHQVIKTVRGYGYKLNTEALIA